jgi:acyl-CoA thioesterase I
VRRQTSEEVVARLEAEARPRLVAGADCRVVLSVGANDATLEDGAPRVAPEASVAALEMGLDACARLEVTVFVVGPPPAGDADQRARLVARSDAFGAVCAQRAVPWAPVIEALCAGGPWLEEAAAGDGVHPGAGGYAQMAALLEGPLGGWLRA